MKRRSVYSLVVAISMFASTIPTPVVAETSGSAGKQFVDEQGAIWLVTDEGCRKAYTSKGAFESFGFNEFKNIQKGIADDLAIPVCAEKFILPREGSIVFSNNKEDFGTGYLISNGKKRGFVSEKIFDNLGFKGKKQFWADVSWIGNGQAIDSENESHAPGTLVNNEGTYEIVSEDGNIGIPDPQTLATWGYGFEDAVPANDSDKQIGDGDVLTKRMDGQLHGREIVRRCLLVLAKDQGTTTGTTSEEITKKPKPVNCPPPRECKKDEAQTQGQQPSNEQTNTNSEERIKQPRPICAPLPPPCPKLDGSQIGNSSGLQNNTETGDTQVTDAKKRPCVPPFPPGCEKRQEGQQQGRNDLRAMPMPCPQNS